MNVFILCMKQEKLKLKEVQSIMIWENAFHFIYFDVIFKIFIFLIIKLDDI